MYQAENILFAGTSVTSGQGRGVVVATGNQTALGDIAHLTALAEKETQFEKDIRHFSAFLLKFLLGTLALVFFLYFFTHGRSLEIIPMLLFTLALAVTVLPEALPAITTVALSRGALVLAKKKVVVKRLSAIEDLGSVQILCTDKTGTLTENALRVADFWGKNKEEAMSYALLAAQVAPSSREVLHDTFDQALWAATPSALRDIIARTVRREELSFNPETRINAALVEHLGANTLIVRGAPEAILKRVEHLDSFTRKSINDWIRERGLRGERVLAIATHEEHVASRGLSVEGKLTLQGLISFLDPIKESTKETLVRARALGVEVKVFSGDSREVVGAVAYAVGLTANPDDVLTGADIEALSLSEQIHALESGRAFARVTPDQKYAFIKLLQKSHVVGFLGEGINDAPALKLANVALVVHGSSDIAREASDIILLDKDLGVIIDGIREGRRVFANILKYLKITLAANFGNFYSVALAAIFLPFLPLLPLQILFLNLLSDFPMLSIATDRVDQEKLERPNRHNMQSILITATLFGAISSFFDLTIFTMFATVSPGALQTAWFLFSVLTEVFLIFSLRSRRWFFQATRPSRLLRFLSFLVICSAFLIPFTSFGTKIGFIALAPLTLGTLFALAVVYFAVTEVVKHWYYLHMPLANGADQKVS
jgi:Mg2+-importing ATPase